MPDFLPPRSRPLAEIYDDLRLPPHPKHLKTKKQGGANITFLPHYAIRDYLDLYAPGWEWECAMQLGPDRLYAVGTLTVHGSDGSVSRAATGTETLVVHGGKRDGEQHAYGDPSSNAESMALRRAAMAHGFCRSLWSKAN